MGPFIPRNIRIAPGNNLRSSPVHAVSGNRYTDDLGDIWLAWLRGDVALVGDVTARSGLRIVATSTS